MSPENLKNICFDFVELFWVRTRRYRLLGHEKTLIIIEYKTGRTNTLKGYKHFTRGSTKNISWTTMLKPTKFDKFIFIFVASGVSIKNWKSTWETIKRKAQYLMKLKLKMVIMNIPFFLVDSFIKPHWMNTLH